MILPDEFKARMHRQTGDAYTAFLSAMDDEAPTSVRLNKQKICQPDFDVLDSVPWEPAGIYLKNKPQFTPDPLFHAGAYYVQEASSMIIGEIIRQLPALSEAALAIDLCAAPGGKSTHLLDNLPHTLLLSNEVVQKRVSALRQNLIRWGNTNALVCNYPTGNLSRSGLLADLVLVDAPCSGEGLFRKDPDSINHWNDNNLRLCAHRQSDILKDAVQMVSQDGYLIYSTCTYNPEENIHQVANLIQSGFEPIAFDFPPDWGIETIQINEATGYQFYPHKLSGEGFFVSVWRKTGTESQRPIIAHKEDKELIKISTKDESVLNKYFQIKDIELVNYRNKICLLPEKHLFVSSKIRVKPLFELGSLIRGEFIPSHALAMIAGAKLSFHSVELNLDQARFFLSKNPAFHPALSEKGILMASYQSHGLGFFKSMQHRVNNYYPQEWRILKDIRSTD